VDPGRTAQLLDVKAAAPLTMTPRAVRLAVGVSLCTVVLALPVDIGGWRVGLGVVATLSALGIGSASVVTTSAAQQRAREAAEATQQAQL
jgi:hypothetical protein